MYPGYRRTGGLTVRHTRSDCMLRRSLEEAQGIGSWKLPPEGNQKLFVIRKLGTTQGRKKLCSSGLLQKNTRTRLTPSRQVESVSVH